ncbi:MAG: Gfo/Idh/MocA family oxidoreductase [Chloroflexota bacterium]|nr:Gfo/Idh/MocA family oxidoreductase [Chloroflexota bacterium]
MSPIYLAVLGLGRMGQVYARHAMQIPGARLAAVADPRFEIAQAFADSVPGVTAYADAYALLNRRDIHAVIVATPTHTHHDVVIAAAAAGKAIFCEKPTSLTLTDTDAMRAAVERAGVPFQVGFMRRFDAGYLNARRQIDSGVIGDPVAVRAVGRDAGRTSLEFANPAVSGGLILDMGIHDFDLARWFIGAEVERVYSETACLVYPELRTVGDVDSAMITLKFASGALGQVEVSRNPGYGYDIQTEVIGSKGTIRIGTLQHTPVVTVTAAGVTHDIVPHFPERFGAAYTAQITHFVESIVNEHAPSVGMVDARAALAIAVAADRSAHEGHAVRMDEITAE